LERDTDSIWTYINNRFDKDEFVNINYQPDDNI